MHSSELRILCRALARRAAAGALLGNGSTPSAALWLWRRSSGTVPGMASSFALGFSVRATAFVTTWTRTFASERGPGARAGAPTPALENLTIAAAARRA